jgi:hypothetical protein
VHGNLIIHPLLAVVAAAYELAVRIVRHLNVVAVHVRCVSSSIWAAKDADESDLEAFEYSNSEAGLRYSSHKQFSNVYMKFFCRFVPRKRPLSKRRRGRSHTCELQIVAQAPLALSSQPHLNYQAKTPL